MFAIKRAGLLERAFNRVYLFFVVVVAAVLVLEAIKISIEGQGSGRHQLGCSKSQEWCMLLGLLDMKKNVLRHLVFRCK